MAKFWIQLDSEGVIRDILEYAYEDYIPVDIPKPLPIGIMSGYYTWDGDQPVLDQVRKAEVDKANRPYDEVIDALQDEVKTLQAADLDNKEMIAMLYELSTGGFS